MGATEGEADTVDLAPGVPPMTVEQFATRHIGPGPDEQRRMLEAVGYDSIDELMDAAIPEVIRWHGTLDLPDRRPPRPRRSPSCGPSRRVTPSPSP